MTVVLLLHLTGAAASKSPASARREVRGVVYGAGAQAESSSLRDEGSRLLEECAALRAEMSQSEATKTELRKVLYTELESSKQQLANQGAEAQAESSSLRDEVSRLLEECAALRAEMSQSEVAEKEQRRAQEVEMQTEALQASADGKRLAEQLQQVQQVLHSALAAANAEGAAEVAAEEARAALGVATAAGNQLLQEALPVSAVGSIWEQAAQARAEGLDEAQRLSNSSCNDAAELRLRARCRISAAEALF
eukprot:s7920_g1.t3